MVSNRLQEGREEGFDSRPIGRAGVCYVEMDARDRQDIGERYRVGGRRQSERIE